jgi:pimeloyl-ACP methyl ester carboxylesterase
MNGRASKHILYFHGFASSPHSQKVTRFRELLHDFTIDAPDLNVPSFEELDFYAMVELGVERAGAMPPDVIVGSSLGAMVALAVAGRVENPSHMRPSHIVLIAPPLGMAGHWLSRLPAGDPISVFNYARNADAPIHRAFFEGMARVDVDREPPAQRVIVIIGRNDETVPFEGVRDHWRKWEASGKLATGSRFVEIPNGDHGLVGFVDVIAEAVRETTPATRPSAARSPAGSP